MDLYGELRSFFTEKALSALDRAASLGAPDQPVDTLDVLLAVKELDAAADWQRIWLHFHEPDPADAARYQDPAPHAGDWWNSRPITVTCACALRASVGLACNSVPSLVPISTGTLALCLIGDSATAACRALWVRSEDDHTELLELAQETLVQGHWDDIKSVLAACYAVPDPPTPDGLDADDPDIRRFLDYHADMIQALVGVLNEFLRAPSAGQSSALIAEHPELLSVAAAEIIEKSVGDAQQAEDLASVEHLRERQAFLRNYRQLTNRPPRETAGTGRPAGAAQEDDDEAAAAWEDGDEVAAARNAPAMPDLSETSALEARLRRLQADSNPKLVLRPGALTDAAKLLASVDELRSHGRLLLMVGGLHYMRWAAYDDRGEDRQVELMVAMALFAPLRVGHGRLLHRRFRKFLDRERRKRPQPGDQPASTALRAYLSAAPPADHAWAELLWQISQLLYREYQRAGKEPLLSESIALLRHAVARTQKDDPDYPERAAVLGSTLLVRHQLTGQSADLDEALAELRSGATDLPDSGNLRQGLLSARGSGLHSLFAAGGDLGALDAAITAHRAALRNLSADDAEYATLALRLAAALLRHHGRTRQAGSLEEAIGTLRDAREAAIRHGEQAPAVLAALANNLSVALTARYEETNDEADLDQAITEAERAVSVADDDDDRASAHGTLGIALIARYVRYAHVEPVSLPSPAYHVEMLRDLLDRAVEHLRTAVRLTPDHSPERATALANLGIGLLNAREAGAPRKYLRKARKAFDAVAVGASGTAPVRALASLVAGRLAADDEDWLAATDRLEAAIDLLAVAVPRGLRREDREYELSKLRDLGCDAAACAWRYGDTERAVSLFERGRGVLLAQEMGAPTELGRLREHDAALARDFTALQNKMARAERRDLVSDPADWRQQTAAEERVVLQARWEGLLARIRAEAGFQGFLKPPEKADLLAVGREGPVILLNVSRYGCAAFVVRDGTVAGIELPGLTPAKARGMVTELLTATDRETVSPLAAQSRLVRLLGWLWDDVVGPVLDQLGITARLDPAAQAAGPRIWWCPAGMLSFLPLHAAGHHDTRFDVVPRTVIDRVISSYTPTIRVLERARQAPGQAAGRMLIVAPGNAGTGGLGLARDDHGAPGRPLREDVTVLADAAATPVAVRAALPDHSRVHFACHAASDLNDPSASYLELYGRERLAVSEVTALRLRHAEFAFLGACSTYQGGPTLADEAIHLGGAFQLAGYRHVIATLWPIKDTPTAARITEAVREGSAAPGGVTATAASLHAATRRERDRAPDAPSLWAPYLHSGG